jgi:hypothetical protein
VGFLRRSIIHTEGKVDERNSPVTRKVVIKLNWDAAIGFAQLQKVG